jgi:hypothetical protein
MSVTSCLQVAQVVGQRRSAGPAASAGPPGSANVGPCCHKLKKFGRTICSVGVGTSSRTVPPLSVRWADIPQLPIRGRRCPPSSQQFWQQSRPNGTDPRLRGAGSEQSSSPTAFSSRSAPRGRRPRAAPGVWRLFVVFFFPLLLFASPPAWLPVLPPRAAYGGYA